MPHPHRSQPRKKSASNRKGAAEKQCPFRGCTFSSKWGVKRHMQTHTGEQKYICKFLGCGFRTAYPHSLKSHRKRHDNTSKPHACAQRSCSFKGASPRELWVHRHEVHGLVKRETATPSRNLAATVPETSAARPQHRREKEGESRGGEKDDASANEQGAQAGARSSEPLKPKFTCLQNGQTIDCGHWDCAHRASKESEATEGSILRGRDGDSLEPSQVTSHSNGRPQKRKRDAISNDSDTFIPEFVSDSEDERASRRNRRRRNARPAGENEHEDVEEDEMDMLRTTRYSQSLDILPEVRLSSPPKRRSTHRVLSVKEEEDRDELDTLSQVGQNVQELRQAVTRQEKMMRDVHRKVDKLCTQGIRIEVHWEDAQPFVREEMRALSKKFQEAISRTLEE